MTWLLTIDPGPRESAWLILDEAHGHPVGFAKERNELVLDRIDRSTADRLAVEKIESYGMAVGETVFSTCIWVGRFIERWSAERDESLCGGRARDEAILVPRREVKLHLCGSNRAKDANVRQALIDRYGPGKDRAVGLKATPGPLYGVSGDVWAALGVAVTAMDDAIADRSVAA